MREQMAKKGRAPESGPEAARQGKKTVTLKDVAEHVGLSPATVSLVLNRAPAAQSIPAETHERVLAAARELDYRPHFVARSLRSRRTFSIGVLVPEIAEGYTTGVLSGIEDHLMNEGYFYLLASHRFSDRLVDENLSVLKDRLVDGLILINTKVTESPGIPTVSISSHAHAPDVTEVIIDHDRAAELALTHLADLGHQRISVLRGHPLSADSTVRWNAIEKAAGSLGLEIPDQLTLQIGDASIAGDTFPEVHYREGYQYGENLMATGAVFTAFFAFNDISAIGAMRAFSDAGVRVPEDISVIGFDDIESAAFHSPSLTTVSQPLHEMGEIASRLLLERLAGGSSQADVITVEPSLVVRESTGPAPSRGVTRLDPGRRDVASAD
jgi:LacI family transcriptional regulator